MKPGRYEHVLSFALSHPWQVLPEFLPVIAAALARHIAGADSSAEIAAALVNRKNLPQPRAGSVAIIPIYGVIAPRMNLFSEYSGGTTFEKLTIQLQQAERNGDIKTIVFDIDSPGGSVAGSPEFAAEVMRVREKKPIIAVGQYMMASAAYRIAAACTQVVASKSACIGSIGTYWMHDDLSAQLALLGINRTFVSSGEGKLDGNETEPLSERAQARRQEIVDEMQLGFVDDVVNGRGKGMTPERVREEWKAFAYPSTKALALGLIDSIATLDQTVQRVLTASPDAADQRAALSYNIPPDDTSQEPDPATDQDRRSETDLERAIFALQL